MKMLNSISNGENTNENHSEMSFHTEEEDYNKKSHIITSVNSEYAEKSELS